MNNVQRNIVITAANNTAGLLNQLGPARNNMAVVEPVAVPMLELPGRVLAPIETPSEVDSMDIDAITIIHSTNATNEPMIDVKISIEEKELEYSEELNIDWIDNKILFNQTN